MADIIFPEGINFKLPPDNAPDYVRGKISIKVKDLIGWLEKQKGDWVNLNVMVSKKGSAYLSVDNWKPNSKKTEEPTESYTVDNPEIKDDKDYADDGSELPF